MKREKTDPRDCFFPAPQIEIRLISLSLEREQTRKTNFFWLNIDEKEYASHYFTIRVSQIVETDRFQFVSSFHLFLILAIMFLNEFGELKRTVDPLYD